MHPKRRSYISVLDQVRITLHRLAKHVTAWGVELEVNDCELGCFTCRLRRKKCDEGHPACRACTNLCVKCEYKRPIWWGNPEQRRLQKERIKNKIKQTKMIEKNGTMQGMRLELFASQFQPESHTYMSL